MPEGLEDADLAVEMHSLLLSMAGLVDDELLGWCRELAAVGESDYALELVVSTVQADRLRLPEALHGELLDAAVRRRVLGRAETFPHPDPAPRLRHRFTSEPAEHGFPPRLEEHSPEAALHSVPSRLLRDAQLWLSWRITPAGGAPGPVPHPVVLIEVSDGAGADVLAYQVAEVLSRAGVFASVEVFASGGALGDYHRAALDDARRVIVSDGLEDRPFGESPGAGGPGPAQPGPTHPNAAHPNAAQPNGTQPGPPRPGPGRDLGRRVGPADGSDTGGIRPVASPQDGQGRPPMHPVDRVITARGSAPRRPRPDNPDRQPGSLDDVAAGLNFGRAGGADPFLSSQPDIPNGVSPADQPPGERGQPDRPREGVWGAGKDASAQPQDTPPVRNDGPRGDSSDHPRPDHPRPSRPGQSPPARPGPQPRGPQPRGPQRPTDQTDPADPSSAGLSDVEQRLLRQLHEELAAREDGGVSSMPESNQPQSRVHRGTNGGRKRPPRPGPDRSN